MFSIFMNGLTIHALSQQWPSDTSTKEVLHALVVLTRELAV